MASDDPTTRERPETQAEDLRDTLVLISELSEAMGGQIRRARRLLNDRPDSDIAPGVLESLEVVADSLHRQCLALVSGGRIRLEPSLDRMGAAAPSAIAPPHGENSTENMVRTLAKDLKREGRPRVDVVRMLAEDFGLENVEHVVSDVFRRA